jgi:hypothetical protein
MLAARLDSSGWKNARGVDGSDRVDPRPSRDQPRALGRPSPLALAQRNSVQTADQQATGARARATSEGVTADRCVPATSFAPARPA